MEDFNLLAPLLLAIVGLLAGAILKSILKRTEIGRASCRERV